MLICGLKYWLITLIIIFLIILLFSEIHNQTSENNKYIERFNDELENYIMKKGRKEKFENTESVISSRDEKSYKVISHFVNKNEASDILSEIHKRNLKLIDYMKQTNGNYYGTKNLIKRYNVKGMYEVDPFNKYGETSFTIDKGKELGLCLRQKSEKKEFVNLQDLQYVVIHELAHLMSNDIGHGPEFRKNFKIALKSAYEINIYSPIVNYTNEPRNYCGIILHDKNPLL